jgi:hypothetical protein
MKLWNLSSFEDLNATVVSTTDEESKAAIELPRRFRKKTAVTMTGTLGAVMLVAAIATTTVTHVNVSGSDPQLRVTASEAASNVVTDRPPLQLLFGGRHRLKWDKAQEKRMLEKAVAALESGGSDDNRMNLIAAVVTEDLPADREHALDLGALGIKLR